MLKKTSFPDSVADISALLFLLAGGFLSIYSLLFGSAYYPTISSFPFLDSVMVPIDWVNLGILSYPIEVENYLIFQEFKALSPGYTFIESYLFGGIIFLISVSVLALFSTFRKIPFLISGASWIIVLTLANSNGLNISSPSSNTPLIILIVVFVFMGIAVFSLIKLSPIPNPALFLSEQSLILGLVMAIAWIFWQGHAVLSGIYLLLARANQNVSMKISWQILGISALYLLTLVFLLLDLKGEVNLPFPTFSPLFLVFPIGILGWLSTQAKFAQVPELAANPRFLKALFGLGFGITLWVIWKLEISQNQAAQEFLKHLIVYSQFGFSLFFVVYIMSNFLSVMDSGKSVDKILFKPYSLPYYHLRIGGVISILVVTIYMDAVLAPQANSLTTNIIGDYYYQTDQKLQASILYENCLSNVSKD